MGETPNYGNLTEPNKEFWIVNGTSTTYEVREEIKSWGGYWDKDHKCWSINDPSEECRSALENCGVRFEFRR